MTASSFGDMIREIRKAKKVTIVELAKKVGLGWNRAFIAGLVLTAFFMAGCGDPGAASRMEKDIAALHKAIERKNEEVKSINARMEAQGELIAKQELDLKRTLAMIREEIGNFRSEIVSMRNGEMVSLKTDLDLLQKKIEVVMSKLKKMSGDSEQSPSGVPTAEGSL